MVTGKILFTISTLFAVGSCIPCSSPSQCSVTALTAYKAIPYAIHFHLEAAWKACPKNSTNQERYKGVLEQARKCASSDFSDRNQSICRTLKDNVQKCSQPLVDYFVDCLPEKSKDIPPALVTLAVSVIDAYCTMTGELSLEITNECLQAFFYQRDPAISEECKEKVLHSKLKKFDKKPPSKAEVCQLFGEIGNCWQESVDRSCVSQTAKEVFTRYYNAVLSPCKT